MYLPTSLVSALGLLGTANAFTKSSGCGKALSSSIKTGGFGSSNWLTIRNGGQTRYYQLHIPANYAANDARGLIFSFHGRGSWATRQEEIDLFSDPRFNADNLVVWPQGINNQWQGDPEATTNDVQFTLDLLNALSSQYCIDTDAVYATGKSNGGGFSLSILACDYTASQKFAAFAGGSGAYYQNMQSTGCQPDTVPIACNPGRSPIPILEIHGSADATIPFYGGERRGKCLPSINHFIQSWASRNLLSTTNVTTKPYNSGVHKHEFGQNGIVTSYWIYGLTHSWASTFPNPDSQTPTFLNGTTEMMNWFNRWTLK